MMQPWEIKGALISKYRTIADACDQLGCTRQELHHTMNFTRVYPEIRTEISKALRMPVEEIFPSENSLAEQEDLIAEQVA